MAVDASGNVYLAGVFFINFTDFLGNAITGNGSNDVFVAKLNSNGVQQWVKSAGSISGDTISQLRVSDNGDVTVGALSPEM